MGPVRRASASTAQPVGHVQRQPPPHSSPGVLILSVAREPLYITPIAHALLVQLDGSVIESWSATTLPAAVHRLCDELETQAAQHPNHTEWEHLEARHLIHTKLTPLLLRGYGLRQQNHTEPGRLLLLIEPMAHQASADAVDVAAGYHFTGRQRAIIDGLVRGLTNKEIADQVQISVHTVKEYIRQLMMKLHTTSRAGIVARVAGLTVAMPPASNVRRQESSARSIHMA